MKALRTTLSVVVLTAALGGVAIASAAATESATPNDAPMRHGGHEGPGGPEGGFHRVLDQLDLTAEQKTQIRAIFDQAKPQLKAVHDSGRTSRDRLEVMPPTDPAYPGLLAAAKSNAAEQIQLASDLWTQVYAKLTPDQRARIPGIVATERDARRAKWQKQFGGQ
jgi:Spy/CpxP family protein refolding chaperone